MTIETLTNANALIARIDSLREFIDTLEVPHCPVGVAHLEEAGGVKLVSYDPAKHGALEDAELGHPIWWWGVDKAAT